MICAIAERIHAPKNVFPPIAVRIPLITPAMMAATKITASVCHQEPLTSFQRARHRVRHAEPFDDERRDRHGEEDGPTMRGAG